MNSSKILSEILVEIRDKRLTSKQIISIAWTIAKSIGHSDMESELPVHLAICTVIILIRVSSRLVVLRSWPEVLQLEGLLFGRK